MKINAWTPQLILQVHSSPKMRIVWLPPLYQTIGIVSLLSSKKLLANNMCFVCFVFKYHLPPSPPPHTELHRIVQKMIQYCFIIICMTAECLFFVCFYSWLDCSNCNSFFARGNTSHFDWGWTNSGRVCPAQAKRSLMLCGFTDRAGTTAAAVPTEVCHAEPRAQRWAWHTHPPRQEHRQELAQHPHTHPGGFCGSVPF